MTFNQCDKTSKQQRRIKTVINRTNEKWCCKYMDFILAYPTRPWEWEWISDNPNLTLNIIEKYPARHWDWREISKKTFNKDKELMLETKYRKHLAAYKIQNKWRNARVDPNCKIGINRINRDIEFMMNGVV